ncbi:mandelate racemase/muconate lactonizing enzyme family protein [uncultured Roseobacter sp.]|uniref:mandelate racemase/muconate lactonizing enzyme family protein n=1 Tax=uncultured Roseobacter sp. TaxID=114847 RepID=UPI0026102C54|nr:mandelate racemase/muconate lactonizing enzyme family protein [uncultured Roseobacter sp.]
MNVIADIRICIHCNDLSGKFWNPAIRWTKKYAVFVEIIDDQGRVGLGECWCFDAAPDTLCAFLRTEVIPAFLGRNLFDLEEISADLIKRATLTARHGVLASALSGLDIAVHDLRAQTLGKPIWKLLNAAGSGKAPLYASGGLYGKNKGLSELGAELSDMAQAGFPVVKMKVGGMDLSDDVSRVLHVLSALPEKTRLVIDAVYSLAPDEALQMFETLPSERIEAFQSPTRADDIAGMARLVRAGVPVMATEAEYRREVHTKLIEDRAVAFLQTAPIACGGFSRLSELADLVRPSNARLSLEVSSTAVALMAACQFAAAEDCVAHVEYHHLHQVFFNHLPWPSSGFEKMMTLPTTPGIGISLPNNEVELAFDTANASPEDADA